MSNCENEIEPNVSIELNVCSDEGYGDDLKPSIERDGQTLTLSTNFPTSFEAYVGVLANEGYVLSSQNRADMYAALAEANTGVIVEEATDVHGNVLPSDAAYYERSEMHGVAAAVNRWLAEGYPQAFSYFTQGIEIERLEYDQTAALTNQALATVLAARGQAISTEAGQ